MTETNDTTSESPNTQTQQTLNSIANGNHLKQKRARSQLSCIPCRQGKLKCNRSHDPACDQCIKRNRESSCLYVPPPVKQKPTQNVKGRIRQLENLVVDLMNQQNTKPSQDGTDRQQRHGSSASNEDASIGPYSQPTPPSDNDSSPQNNLSSVNTNEAQDDVEGATKPFGRMRISKDGISYVGETHWQAILNGISDLKRDLGDDEPEEEANGNADEEAGPTGLGGTWTMPAESIPETDGIPCPVMGGARPAASTGLGFMLGAPAKASRDELIKAIPDKKKADRLLSLWFNSPDPFKPIIHAPTFQDEYRRYWKDPDKTPTMWLGLLFAILSLAASFGLRDNDPDSENAKSILLDVNKYHSMCGAAAVLADFTKPKQYTIECLILYAAGLRSNDAFVNVWLMIGLIIRLCLRQGYHRDPGNYPGISTFDGEMRRRVWSIISMIDVLISFQLGLPSMIKTIQSDTLPPRNLLDRDFNINTKELPPGRGVGELTPSSYTRAKLRLTRVFANAAELSHQTIPPTYEDMMKLDQELQEAKAAIPPLLQMPDISELVTDPAEQLMCRFNIDLLYLKTRMVLHRRYMEKPFAQLSQEEQVMGIGRSRKICTQSALKVLQHHHTIYTASQSGGQLESVKWYMGSISTHDFLLAAMIICLELSHQIGDNWAIMNPSGRLCPQRAAMMDALERSQKIWSDSSRRKRKPNQFVGKDEHVTGEHMFDETEKASRAMAVMLEKVKARFPQQATALANLNNNSNGTAESPIPMGYMSDELGLNTPLYTSQGIEWRPGTTPFGGVVSFHQWGNMSGVPDSVDMSNSNTAFSNGTSNPATTNSNSNNPSPEQFNDFAMIGDMLDMQGQIDWEMFDSGVNTKGQLQLPWQQQQQQEVDLDPFSAGNLPIAAGNAMVGGGTGPGSGTMVYPGSWMSFQDMEDVNFDPGVGDFGMAGMGTQGQENGWANGNGMG